MILIYFVSGILAGFCISCGGILNLLIKEHLNNEGGRFIGAVVFSLGLTTICIFKLKLYTGQVSRLFIERNEVVYIQILLMLFGNLLGAAIFGTGFHYVYDPDISKEPHTWEQWFKMCINGVYCGLCVQSAVTSYATHKLYIGIPLVMFYISLFVYSGFEHCIANMFYVSITQEWTLRSVFGILMTIVTNAIGTLPYVLYYYNQNK